MKDTFTYAQVLEMAIKICSTPANIQDYSDVAEKLSQLKEKYTNS